MRVIVTLLLVLGSAPLRGQVPTPLQHFGFEPGEDGKLLSWEELSAYYRAVDRACPNVHLDVIGRTTGGRNLLRIIVSDRSPGELEKIRRRQRTLARAETTLEDLEQLAQDQPAVVYVQGTLHSTEIGASVMFPAFLHRLATGEDAPTRAIRENVVLILVPSANPDGQDLVVNWYRSQMDGPWEGSSPPELYHRYAGHDDNRDWFMLSLRETQLVSRVLYEEWFPEIVVDIHQMGSRGARMFVPPYADPVNPNLPPLLLRQLDLVGTHMALALTRHGCKGVVQDTTFDNWWNGGARNVPYRHNMIGILTETAAARLASPLWLSPGDLRGQGRGLPEPKQQGNFPDPWPGGWWRMRDIVKYQSVSTYAVLDLASRRRESFIMDFHRLGREAVAAGEAETPHAFLIPHDQPDRGAVRRLVDNLLRTGITVRRATAPFVSGGTSFAKGTWIVPLAQAFRSHAKDLLEVQRYPRLRLERGGDVIQPYDASGWTLPLQFGLRCVPAGEPLPDDLASEIVSTLPPPTTTVAGSGSNPVLPPSSNDAFLAVNRALRRGMDVRRRTPSQGGGFLFAGSDRAAIEGITGDLELVLSAADAVTGDALVAPRVGLYQPWPASMDGGWTRLVLEEHGFEPVLVHAPDVRRGNLRDRFDALVIPSVRASRLRNGPEDRLPKKWQGGLGSEGAQALRRFVRAGGRLLAFAAATDYVIDVFDLPYENALATQDGGKAKVVVPGSLLRAVPLRGGEDGPSRLARELLTGLPDEFTVYVSEPRGFSGSEDTHVLRWPGSGVLQSGYIEGEDHMAGLSALVATRVGEGRIYLYAFRPQHRSQTLGTFRLIFNALY